MKEYPSVEALFEAFAQQKVMVIGDTMVDSYIWGTVERISPEAPVPVVRTTSKDFRLGGAGNVILNLAALNATPVLCTLIGNDEDGKKIMERMMERGLTTDGLVATNERPTTVKTRVLSGHQHVVRVDEESDTPASQIETEMLIEKIDSLLPGCTAVIFEDYDKGVITKKLIEHVVESARRNKIPVIVDPKKRNFLNYHNIDLFKPNLKELREGLKLDSLKSLEDIKKAATDISTLLNAKGTLTTLSEKGAYIEFNNDQWHAPAHLREVSDVSGAGDTVVSIAALCVAVGLPAQLIVELSNLAGGLVCEHVGVVPVNREDFMEESRQYL